MRRLRRLTWRRWLLILLAVAAVPVVILYGKWREASRRGGQLAVEPFRIAGNLYYVGANDVTSFLLTGPEGHVLIDGGYPGGDPNLGFFRFLTYLPMFRYQRPRVDQRFTDGATVRVGPIELTA